ncbi:nSTAND3 domain-containing NTPase [Cytobacillus sp. FSL R7-0680]|uniref:nSTAND3 domain-containing NTPase n=1 Tax=Cytobacillus sp. FSL R7-0680 TaxID=2921689 RepID=UPI0030F97B85
MSVELSGPQGYEYQYLMTILVALEAYQYSGAQLIVEAEGGEDAELRIPTNGGIKTVEVQVKSESAPLELRSITTWLAHFPDHNADNNLLSRIDSDDFRSALFIAKGRCTDETQLFRTNNLGTHNSYPLVRDKVDNLLGILSECYMGKPGSLFENRHQFCEQQSRSFAMRKRELQRLSKRILVWEQMDTQSVKRNILSNLNMDHSIPQGQCESVLRMLDDAIKNARNEREDVMPEVVKILEGNASERMFTGYHTSRQDIEICYQQLKEQHVLLLTGISFCGKTHTAEFIAERFRREGYVCSKAPTVDDAIRFLNDVSIENRLCILEDPFGGTELLLGSAETWGKLSTLTTKTGNHRKLIVTSRIDLIQMVTRETNIDRWKIQSFDWNDITVYDSNLALAIWEHYCEVKQVSEEVKIKISQNLNRSVLQPGQLRHLAYKEPADLENKNVQELERMAKADAIQLGQAFINKRDNELELLLIALGIGLSPTKGISEDQIFKLTEKLGIESRYRFEEKLEFLEAHGYIKFKNNSWQFTHPTYYESAIFIIEHQGRFKQKRILDMVNLAVSSSSNSVLLNIVKKFESLFLTFAEFKSTILDQAFLCLNHKSPAIRDSVLPFIISQIAILEQDKQTTVMQYIENGGVERLNLIWENDIPEIIENPDFSLHDMLGFRQNVYLAEEEIKDILEKLAYPDHADKVPSQEVWMVSSQLILLLDKQTNIRYLKQLMTYDEEMIRNKAAYFIMLNFGNNPELTNVVFQDPHPFVIKNAIRGCFQAWPTLLDETRQELIQQILNVLKKPDICAAINNFMIKFSNKHKRDSIDWEEVHESWEPVVWQLWARLFPVFLNSVPTRILDVDQGYLFTTFEASVEFLDDELKFDIAQAWYNWLERYIENKLPQDYGLGIANFLLTHISKPDNRYSLGKQLLHFDDSNLVAVSLTEYISAWDKLSVDERSELLNVFQTDRGDLKWLWAIVLTRRNVPQEILNLEPGVSAILSQPIETWSESLPDNVLNDCLAVVTGYYSIFDHIGLVETDYETWSKVTIQVFHKPYHLAFPIAIKWVINKTFRGAFKKEDVATIENAWKNLCVNPDKEIRDSCFKAILEETIRHNNPYSEKLWALFFDAVPEEEEQCYVAQIISRIERISRNCDWLSEIFGGEIEKKLLYHLPDDVYLLSLLFETKELPTGEVFALIEDALSKYKPRLFNTINQIRRRLNVSHFYGGTPHLRELIKSIIDEILDRKIIDSTNHEIENWIFSHK